MRNLLTLNTFDQKTCVAELNLVCKSQKHAFHILDASPYPFLVSFFLLTLLVLMTLYMRGLDLPLRLPRADFMHASFLGLFTSSSKRIKSCQAGLPISFFAWFDYGLFCGALFGLITTILYDLLEYDRGRVRARIGWYLAILFGIFTLYLTLRVGYCLVHLVPRFRAASSATWQAITVRRLHPAAFFVYGFPPGLLLATAALGGVRLVETRPHRSRRSFERAGWAIAAKSLAVCALMFFVLILLE